MEMQFKNEIKKLADIVVWADNLITAAGFDVEKYKNDAASAYCHVKAHELWKIKTVVLESIDRHTVYTNALNKDIADKAAKIDLLEKEIEGRKEGYYALKEKTDELEKELADCKVKIRHQKENLDGINKTLEIRTKENESLITVKNNQDREIEAHESENARLSERIKSLRTELANERNAHLLTRDREELYKQKILERNETINAVNDAIVNFRKEIGAHEEKAKRLENSIKDWKATANNYEELLKAKGSEIEKLKVDLIHEREKNEKLARAHAELENDMRRVSVEVSDRDKVIADLKQQNLADFLLEQGFEIAQFEKEYQVTDTIG